MLGIAIALNFKHVLGWKLPDGNYFGMANILIMVAQVVIASMGDDVTLACTAEGHPTPQITWSR